MALKPKSYETLYLVRPDISGEELTSIQKKLINSIVSNQGEIQKNEKWADRDLAYSINNYTKGSYHILIYKALPKVVADLEKHLTFNKTDVLRFITVLNEQKTPPKESTVQSSFETTANTSFTSSNSNEAVETAGGKA